MVTSKKDASLAAKQLRSESATKAQKERRRERLGTAQVHG